MNALTIILLTLLITANVFVMCILVMVKKNKKSKADKIGFTFMELLFVANIMAIIGGVL